MNGSIVRPSPGESGAAIAYVLAPEPTLPHTYPTLVTDHRGAEIRLRLRKTNAAISDSRHRSNVVSHCCDGSSNHTTAETGFDPEWRVLGFVETPRGMDILRIGVDFILARVMDESEVKYGMRTDGWRIRSARIRHL